MQDEAFIPPKEYNQRTLAVPPMRTLHEMLAGGNRLPHARISSGEPEGSSSTRGHRKWAAHSSRLFHRRAETEKSGEYLRGYRGFQRVRVVTLSRSLSEIARWHGAHDCGSTLRASSPGMRRFDWECCERRRMQH